MRNIIFIIAFTSLLFSCSSDSNSSSNNNGSNNGNSFTNSMDYEFTITINGEVHKIKGTENNGSIASNNGCIAFSPNLVSLKTYDVSSSNYISGQNISCDLIFSNLLLGASQANVLITSPYLDTLASNLGATSSIWSSATGRQAGPDQKQIFTITDLGTTSGLTLPYNYGETLKGNYSGTIYLSNHSSNGYPVYDIPVQLSIDFKALRMY
jgi:hypothetical protein